MSKKSKKISGDYILDMLRNSYCNDNGSADVLIDSVFTRLGVKRVVGPPPTNLTPSDFIYDVEDHKLGHVLASKPIHVSSGDKEWSIVSYYEAPDGHMCIDIEEV